MDIRSEIRVILMEVFVNEAEPTTHFKDRVSSRLSSELYTTPKFNYGDVKPQIDVVKKVNFDPKKSYAVKLKSFNKTFVSKDTSSGKSSIGNELWAIVRNNEIGTIFFRNSNQKNQPINGVEHKVNFDTLYNYYNSHNKNADGTVNLNVVELRKKKSKGRKEIELNLPSIEIGGVKWFVDEKNENIIYSKNIKKTISFDDLREEILEKAINSAITHQSI